MNGSIDLVTDAARKAQEKVYEAILELINQFEITDGRFVTNQALSRRIMVLERKIKAILGDIYSPSILDYLPIYRTAEERNIALQEAYNGISVPQSLIGPARKTLYEQASWYLQEGLADAYIQPAKYLVMQQVTRGMSLKDTKKVLQKWHEGELPQALNNGRQTPNLQKYATQVSRDTLYQYYGAVNELIATEYELTSFVYTGDVIEDSRPLCRHLVSLRRKIALDEMGKLLKQYPQGLYPGTNERNFLQLRGGYSCRHGAFAVRA